jgi:hypothetical protein
MESDLDPNPRAAYMATMTMERLRSRNEQATKPIMTNTTSGEVGDAIEITNMDHLLLDEEPRLLLMEARSMP